MATVCASAKVKLQDFRNTRRSQLCTQQFQPKTRRCSSSSALASLHHVASLTQAVGVSSFHKTLLVHAETAAEMAGSTWKAHIESNPSLPPQIHCKAIVPTASEGIPHRNACLKPAETKKRTLCRNQNHTEPCCLLCLHRFTVFVGFG